MKTYGGIGVRLHKELYYLHPLHTIREIKRSWARMCEMKHERDKYELKSKFSLVNMKRRDHSEDLGAEESTILN
jgi:hypothetical protein